MTEHEFWICAASVAGVIFGTAFGSWLASMKADRDLEAYDREREQAQNFWRPSPVATVIDFPGVDIDRIHGQG